MDWSIESTSVVILGAGFSAAMTDGRLPLMTGYFDRLKKDRFPELFELVREIGCNQVCQHIEDANVERVLLAVDQIRRSPFALLEGWLGPWKDKLQVIQEQMSYYTLFRLQGSLRFKLDNWAVNVLAACGLATTVVSMNYDNIAESILSRRAGVSHCGDQPTCPHCKMRVLLEHACSCQGQTRITDDSWRGAILKPHGSIAWKRCINPVCCSFECLVADRYCRPFDQCQCPHCNRDCAPVMVMPTMSKNLDDLPEISTMWQAARMAICEAKSLLLFGFSFPTMMSFLFSSFDRRAKRIAA